MTVARKKGAPRRTPTVDARQVMQQTATMDHFANVAAKLGIDQQNLLSGGTYNFQPISRNRFGLECAYRGSWIVRQAIDVIPEDMTREGIEINCDMTPDDIDKIYKNLGKKAVWAKTNEALRWSRLYGGALMLIQIEGQDPSTPLRPETIGQGQFKGVRVLDRWMVQPSLSAGELIYEEGPMQGLPMYYDVVVEAGGLPRGRWHHSRVIRFEGADLPFFQRQMENLWGLSVLEPLWDRLIAFDSVSMGAAQLVFKAYLRTLYIDGYRHSSLGGTKMMQSIRQMLAEVRTFQQNEGLLVVDSKDKVETTSYTFAGLDNVLLQFAQQLGGSLGIPLVRLFGMSPAGLNSTGESDIRNFYDRIKELQEAVLREPIMLLLVCEHMSTFGRMPGTDFSFSFNTLWQLNEKEKGEVAASITDTVMKAFSGGAVDRVTTLKELSQQSKITGVWSNITDEDIDAAAQAPPPIDPMTGLPGAPGVPGSPGSPSVPGAPPVANDPAAAGAPAGPDTPAPDSGSDVDGGDELEQLHDKVRGANLTGAPEANEGGAAKTLQLKPEHEIELLSHRLHGVSLEKPKGDFGLNELEDLHRKIKGKPLARSRTRDAPGDVRLSTPLFIKLLEHAREDDVSDEHLHKLTEKAEQIPRATMEHYEALTDDEKIILSNTEHPSVVIVEDDARP